MLVLHNKNHEKCPVCKRLWVMIVTPSLVNGTINDEMQYVHEYTETDSQIEIVRSCKIAVKDILEGQTHGSRSV